jgi:hypothetical protein
MKCPPISQSLVIADDAQLAAKISCALARPGIYLPVIEGPRMQRSDHDIEVVRRNNAAARVKPNSIFLTGLPDNSVEALIKRFTGGLQSKLQRLSTPEDIERLWPGGPPATPPLVWRTDRIGIGLLKALRAGSNIVFEDKRSPVDSVPSKSTHLVVCEEGDELAQVIAANYAFSLKARLCLIPEVEAQKSEQLLESFYSLYDERKFSATEVITHPLRIGRVADSRFG